MNRKQMNRTHLLILFVCLVWVMGLLVLRAESAEIKPTRIVTARGITLLMLSRSSIPIVSVEVRVKAGSARDPEAQSGLANMTASLLEQGTTRRSATQIAETIDAIGGRLSVETEEDFTSVTLQVLKKDVDVGMDLLADILMAPAFGEVEVARVRRNVLSLIAAESDQPKAMAERAFRKLVFSGHPYQYPVIGREETAGKLDRSAIVTFHKTYFRPNNTIMAVVGDVTQAEVVGLAQKYFSAWEPGSIPALTRAVPAPLQKQEIQWIDKPDLTQATLMLGHVGIHRAHPDYYAVSVMNYILGGGGFSSRMMADVRDNQGLVYSIFSLFNARQMSGSFSVSLQTKNESVGVAIDAVLAQIKRIQNGLVSEAELSETQGYLTGSFPLRIDSTAKFAAMLAAIEFQQLGLDYFEKYPQSIRAVTREDVLRVAKTYLNPAHYALVGVGSPPTRKTGPK